jgi:hypothetical protein
MSIKKMRKKYRISRTIRPLYIPVEKFTKLKAMGSQPVYASTSLCQYLVVKTVFIYHQP